MIKITLKDLRPGMPGVYKVFDVDVDGKETYLGLTTGEHIRKTTLNSSQTVEMCLATDNSYPNFLYNGKQEHYRIRK